jgi:hypothetical protein
MREDDCAQDGWQALADYVGCSIATIKKRAPELKKSGVVFVRWKGRPKRKVVTWFPSVVRQYLSLKGSKGEMF